MSSVLDTHYTVQRAAEVLGLSDYRVAELCRQGLLEGAEKVGCSWVIPRRAVAAFRPPRGGRRRKKSVE